MKAKPTKKAAAKAAPAKSAAPKASTAKTPAAAPRKAPAGKPAKAAAAKVSTVPKPAAPPVPMAERRVDKARRAQWRKEMEKYRVVLLAKQRELTDAYATVKDESREAPGGDGTEDYIDYAVNSYAKEFLLSLTELDRKQLILVEDALRRIDRGEYGRCMQCGDPINPKRLEVQPWARHCVRCQELEEQGLLPQYGSHASGEPLEEEEEVDLEVDTIPLEDEPGAEADDEE